MLNATKNHEFNQWCGVNAVTYGTPPHPTFADDCVTGWWPSHGTPQILWHDFAGINSGYTPATRPLWHVAFMWAEGDEGKSRGEGIFAPYTFKKDNTYKIKMRYTGYLEFPSGGTTARIEIVAAQDIKRPGKWKAGNLVPKTLRQQSIATITTNVVTVWRESSEFIFTADNDYNQLWIFPYVTNYNQYNLLIDWAQVCREDCISSIYYKQGVLPLSEPRFGSVYVGTSYGGTGTVTVQPTAQTTVIAAYEIIFKPAFAATVTSGSFSAKIQQGGCNTTYSRPNQDRDTSMAGLPHQFVSFVPGESTYLDEYGVAGRPNPNNAKVIKEVNSKIEEGLLIYPNPVRGNLNIDINSANKGKIRIRVLNAQGIVKKDINATAGVATNHFEIDTRALSDGLYFIQLVDVEGKVTVKKIFVNN